MGLSGTGSNLAKAVVVLSIMPCLFNRLSSELRFLRKMARFLPGCTSDGELGKTAIAAISPQDNLSGLRPKYRHDAASNPITFVPNGALLAYRPSISFLP